MGGALADAESPAGAVRAAICWWCRTRPRARQRWRAATRAWLRATGRSRWWRRPAATTSACAPPAPTAATTCARVRTAAGRSIPRTERRSLAGKEAPERDEALALVQFVGPPKDAWLERLRATGARARDLPGRELLRGARGDGEAGRAPGRAGRAATPPVRAVAVLTAADKLEDGPGDHRAATRCRPSPAATAPMRAPTPRRPVRRWAARWPGRAAHAVPAAVGGGGGGPGSRSGGGGRRALRRARAGRRARRADRGRQPQRLRAERARLPGLAGRRRSASPTTTTFDFAIDVTDERARQRLDPPIHSRLPRACSGASRVRLPRTTTRATPAPTRPRTAAATAPTSPRSPPATTTAPAPPASRTAPASTTGSGWRRSRRWARPRSSTAPAVAGGFDPGDTGRERLRRRRAHLQQLVGHGRSGRSGAPTPRAPSSTTRVVRDARSSDAGNQELVEVFAAGNDGEGNPGAAPQRGLRDDPGRGHGQERDHGRRGGGRAAQRHRRLRRVRQRRRQRARHHRLLEPRAHRRRAPQARPGGAGHAHGGRPAAARRLHRRTAPASRSSAGERVLLAGLRHVAGRARRCRAPPRWCATGTTARRARSLAGADQGAAGRTPPPTWPAATTARAPRSPAGPTPTRAGDG